MDNVQQEPSVDVPPELEVVVIFHDRLHSFSGKATMLIEGVLGIEELALVASCNDVSLVVRLVIVVLVGSLLLGAVVVVTALTLATVHSLGE